MRSTTEEPDVDGAALGSFLAPMPFLFLLLYMYVTDRLVSGKRLDKAEKRAEKLEAMVWESLGVTGRAVEHAEVTHDVLAALPDPNRDEAETP